MKLSEKRPLLLHNMAAELNSTAVLSVEFSSWLKIDRSIGVIQDDAAGFFKLRNLPRKQNFPRFTELVSGSSKTVVRKQLVKIRDFIFLQSIVSVENEGHVLRVRDQYDVICIRVSKENYQSLLNQLDTRRHKLYAKY
jgi:hypothetical protein